jgi:hypothetical protein
VNDPRSIETVALDYVDDVEAQLRGDILSRAHKHFGYRADSFRAKGPLAAALTDLDIRPLRSEQVGDYMNSKVKSFSFHTGYLVTPLLLACVAFYWIAMHWHYRNWDLVGFTDTSWSASALVMGIFGSVVGTVLSFVAGVASPKYERTSSWWWFTLGPPNEREQAWKFKSYSRYIPVHVLNMAVQVKEACPDARFYVKELTTKVNKMKRSDPDPFLHVELGPESYWLAVWDEREFEARA